MKATLDGDDSVDKAESFSIFSNQKEETAKSYGFTDEESFDKAKINLQTMFSVALASYNNTAAVNSIIFFALNNQEWLHMAQKCCWDPSILYNHKIYMSLKDDVKL